MVREAVRPASRPRSRPRMRLGHEQAESHPQSTGRLHQISLRRLWPWLLLAVVIRYALMWFNHPWDITTFYNMFVNLSQGVSPYVEFDALSRLSLTSTNHWVLHYEYFAYPPGLIYLYYVPAQVWGYLTGPVTAHWLLPGLPYVIPPTEVLNPVFQTLFKMPIFMADVGIGVLVGKLGGRRAMLAYLFNPLVILVSASWTFEAIPLLCVVAAYFLVVRGRPALAGLALGFGTVLKIYPVVLVPLIALEYLRRRHSRKLWQFMLSFVSIVTVAIAPWWEGVGNILQFHALRRGGGLTLHQIVYLYETLTTEPVLWLQAVLSPGVGAITLIVGLSLSYLWVLHHQPPLLNAFIVVIAVFFLGSKLVNEQFTMWLIPFLILGAVVSEARERRRFYWLVTSVPLIFAAVNVPVTGFLYPLGHWGMIAFESLSMPSEAVIGTTAHAMALTAIAMVFVFTLALIVRHYGRAVDAP